jgi:leader peptidase (prepilin peptidase)/N-methyltransferase
LVASIAVLGGALGLVFGSFLNVVAYRVPLGRSIARPASACPHCRHPIRTRDNIPVVSWLLLRGRCRDCAEPIAARYPIVEATTGLLFAAVPLVLQPSWTIPAYWAFIAVTVALTLTDLDHKLIPNRILFPGIAVAAPLLLVGAVADGDPGRWLHAAAGAAAYFGLLFALALVARGGLGFGDVKLAILLGMFLTYRGWDILLVGGFLAFFLGGAVSLLLLAFRIKGRKDAIPFGPYLVVGAYLALAFGEAIADWYLRAS